MLPEDNIGRVWTGPTALIGIVYDKYQDNALFLCVLSLHNFTQLQIYIKIEYIYISEMTARCEKKSNYEAEFEDIIVLRSVEKQINNNNNDKSKEAVLTAGDIEILEMT